MIWAEHEQTGELVKHTRYGRLDITLDSTPPPVAADGTVATVQLTASALSNEELLYLWHGIVMVFSWGLLGLLMCCTNRWMVHLSDKIQYVHSLLGFIMMGCTIGLIVPLVQMEGFYLGDLHNMLGFAILMLVILVSLQGIATYAFK